MIATDGVLAARGHVNAKGSIKRNPIAFSWANSTNNRACAFFDINPKDIALTSSSVCGQTDKVASNSIIQRGACDVDTLTTISHDHVALAHFGPPDDVSSRAL